MKCMRIHVHRMRISHAAFVSWSWCVAGLLSFRGVRISLCLYLLGFSPSHLGLGILYMPGGSPGKLSTGPAASRTATSGAVLNGPWKRGGNLSCSGEMWFVVILITHMGLPRGGEGPMFWLFRTTLLLDLYPKVERTSQRSPYVECLLNLCPLDKPLLTDRFFCPGLSMHSPLIFYSYHPRNPRPLRPSIWCGPTGRSAVRRPEFLLRVCKCLCRHSVINVSVKIIHTFWRRRQTTSI